MVTAPNYDSPSTLSDDTMSDDLDIRNAVEAAFGPGAFELMGDGQDVEPDEQEPVAIQEDSQDIDDEIVPDSQLETLSASEPSQHLVFEIGAVQHR